MSQAPAGKNDWLRGNYEKLILLVALLALLGSSAWLSSRFGEDEILLLNLSQEGARIQAQSTGAFEDRLAAYAGQQEAVPEVAKEFTVSEIRVSCVKCGRPIPFNALECPFCLGEQPPIIDASTVDTDVDGIPDVVEIAWGLNPNDPLDALQDMDGDGFTNLEEYQAKTDPKDPLSRPPLIVKLRVAQGRAIPFHLRFVGTTVLSDGTKRFQMNMRDQSKTFFGSIGDVVEGWRIEENAVNAQGEETLTLVRQSDARKQVLVKGRLVTEQELWVLLVSLADRTTLKPPLQVNGVFTLDGHIYKVVDIAKESVLIQDTESGGTTSIAYITPGERAMVSGQAAPAPPPPPVAVAPAPQSALDPW